LRITMMLLKLCALISPSIVIASKRPLDVTRESCHQSASTI
jgi:hypothetical protein